MEEQQKIWQTSMPWIIGSAVALAEIVDAPDRHWLFPV